MKRSSGAIALFVLCCAMTFGQTPASTAPQGVPYENYGLFSIDLQDMSMVFNIPIRSKPRFSATYTGAANRYGYYSTPGYIAPIGIVSLLPYEYATRNLSVNGTIGGSSLVSSGGATLGHCSNGDPTYIYGNWYVEDASGTVHSLPTAKYVDFLSNGTSCFWTTFTAQTTDFKYKVTITKTTAQIWANDGSTSGPMALTYDPATLGKPDYTTAITSWKDKNGNVTSANSTFTSWTDEMQGIAPLTATYPVSTGEATYSWTDVNGGTQNVTVTTSNMGVKTSFGCPAPAADLDLDPDDFDFVTGVSFPDGSSLSLAYEPNTSGYTTGRISQITLPTGGTISFTYSGFNCTYMQTTYMTMTTSDGTWTYTWAPLSYGSGSSETYGNTVTVQDPAGNKVVHTYIGLGASNTATNTFGVFEVARQSFAAGSSTATTTVATCYNGNSSNCMSTAPAVPLSASYSATLLSGMTAPQEHYQTFDVYGDVLSDTLYDFAAAHYIETTKTFNATAACSSNINAPGLLCTTEKLFTGAEVSGNTLTYDASGDVLTVNSYMPGNTTITTTNTFNSNGTVATSTSPSGVTTTFTYGDCNGFMPTKVALSSALYTSYTYGTVGCDGGVPVSRTDSNGNITNLYYSAGAGADPWYRQLISEDPQGNYYYHEYSPTNTVAYMQFASSVGLVAQEVDGYGRVINVQKENGPSSTLYDTASTTFVQSTTGGLGTLISGYAPCTTGYHDTCESTLRTATQLDYLGRPATRINGEGGVVTYSYDGNDVKAVTTPAPSGENAKAVITESNGLWTTISCAVVTSTLPAGSSCGTGFIAGVGYPETFGFSVSSAIRTYTDTVGSQTHTQTIDALGRMVTESYPESGTTHYYYDAQSPHGCPASNGRLTEKDDAKGNEVCYTYDAYGRVTKIAANGTQCRLFFFDNSTGFVGAIPSGVTVSNPYGHEVEATTTDCLTTLLTDEWMSYDSLNRVNNAWESTPHSGGYYHASETYFPNNVVNVETLGTSLSATYSVDAEGRWSGAQIGAASTVTSTTYSAEQRPLIISFPTGEVSTTTTSAIAQHATTFTVASAANIVINQNLTVDTFTGGGPEEVQVASISGTTVTVNSPGFHHPHSSGVPVVSQTGDEDVYTYNASNGGLASFEFVSDESGGYLSGSLTYNDNGTVAGLRVYDTFNAGGNQTCAYLYDDLSRLASDLCGTGSANYRSTMTYDQYDNITKSSSNGTAPTWPVSGAYSASSNQLSSSTYDGNGSSLTDYFHTYSWDGFNKMLTLDSNTLTYDALGRVVEVGASGAYTQTWYTPVGTKVLMNGSKIVKAHLPMPGGLSADWTPTATYINHKDWIGSTRLSTQAGAVYTDQALGAYGENTAQEYGASGEFNYAGLTQDIETSVFDTPAREYMPFQSRWPSVDPAHRSWNGYAYVTDPLSGADRTGLGENGETGNDPNSPPNDGSPTYYQYDEMGPDTASIAMSDDTIDGSLPQLTATVDTIISDSTQAYIGGYSTDFQGTDANNGELVFGANVYAPTPTGSTVSQSSSDSSGGFLDNSVNLASGVPAPATNSDPPCKIGNCTYTIYTEPHYPPGNACSGAHNEKGKPATFVSLWDCVGTVSNCKQNQHFYQDSCDNAGNTPMECMYECNLQAGACSYTCQCCNYR